MPSAIIYMKPVILTRLQASEEQSLSLPIYTTPGFRSRACTVSFHHRRHRHHHHIIIHPLCIIGTGMQDFSLQLSCKQLDSLSLVLLF